MADKDVGFPSMSVIVRPLWDIASLGEFASGVPLRLLMTFYMSLLLVFNIAAFLASFVASLASLHTSIHSCRLVLMVRRNQLQARILAHTCGVIQNLAFRRGFVLPMCVSATEFKMLVNLAKRFDRFDSVWRFAICLLTSLLTFYQSTPSPCHFVLWRRTG